MINVPTASINLVIAPGRRRKILQLLEEEGIVKVEELSGILAVSQVTIRKDLAELEEQGMLQRTYGGAVFSHRSRFNTSFFQSSNMRSSPKNAIALAALEYIHEGDSIILDAGSTTFALAQLLHRRFRSLYIITSSVPAALELSQAGYEIFLVGGQVRNHSLALIGPVAIKTLETFHADLAFLGTSGVTLTHGYSIPNTLDAAVKKAMMRSADETYVLTDSTKFGHACLTSFAGLNEVHLTITDFGMPAEFVDAFKLRGIRFQAVNVEPAPHDREPIAEAV
jgi:DeoR family transcriptional regulator of aga operon/DeoR family fructose operon transcriptional repressor